MRTTKLLLILIALFAGEVRGQHLYLPLDARENIGQSMSASRRGIWPARLDDSTVKPFADSLNSTYKRSGFWSDHWAGKRLSHADLLSYGEEDWEVAINPILTVHAGHEVNSLESRSLLRNTRGGRLEGRLGSTFTFESTLIESQQFVPLYLSEYVADRGVIIGEGIAKPFNDGGWDHRWSSGNISYTPSKFFNFSLGQGSFFYGEGYRSLLWSDNALNSPYFRIETTFGPFVYVNLWTQMYDIRSEVNLNPGNRRKWVSSHYLSWDVDEHFNISFFEAVVFGSDTTNGGMDASFFNPIIFYRPIEDQIDSRTGNALLGMSTSYRFNSNHKVYGQAVLDEFNADALTSGEGSWLNKFGFQLGYYFQKQWNTHWFSARAEWNHVRPFTYTHRRVLTNYAHFGQPIAHPLGTNFSEGIVQLKWMHKRWSVEARLSMAQQGVGYTDTTGRYYGQGSDLWVSYNSRDRDNGYDVGGDPSTTIVNGRLEVAWLAQSAWRLEFFGQLGYRSGPIYPLVSMGGQNLSSVNSTWFQFGVRTRLYRTYDDI